MKYIKTYESFNINETMDMVTMPVDPIKGISDVIGDIKEATLSKFKEKMVSMFNYILPIYDILSPEQLEYLISTLENTVGKERSELSYSDITLSNFFKFTNNLSSDIIEKVEDYIQSIWNKIWGSEPVIESSSSKKIKAFALACLMMVGTMIFIYKGLESQTPGMVKFLKHEGYPNAQVETINPLMNQVTFKSDSGYVDVKSYKGIYQILY